MLKRTLKRSVPAALYRPVTSLWRRLSSPLGIQRSLKPLSKWFERGQPIDRFYIEEFLQQHRDDVRSRVLEAGDSSYTMRFGGNAVTQADVLNLLPGDPHTTILGDLSTGAGIPSSAFDCMVLTQVLQFIYDVRAAVANVYAALKPGGVLLASVPGISQISRYDMEQWGDYWRFTDASARLLFASAFGPENVSVHTHGNVLTACAFLHGFAAHELQPEERAYCDPDYQLVITVRAVKSPAGAAAK